MKNYFNLFLLAAFAFTISSCSKEDVGVAGDDIVGAWDLVGYNYTGTSTTTGFGQTILTEFDAVGKNFDSSVEFLENPNTYKSMGSFQIDLVATTNGNSTTTTVDFDGDFDDGSWTRDGNNLTITNMNGEMIEAEIITLNETNLVLTYEFTRVETDNGFTITQVVSANQTYERQ